MKNIDRIITESIQKVLNEGVSSLRGMVFLAYGSDKFDINRFRPYDNARTMSHEMNKPIGGLWASPLDSECGWGKWCSVNEFAIDSLDKHFLFKLSPGAKIYVIDNKEDIKSISTLRGYYGERLMNFQSLIDAGYDGIFVTANAIKQFRMFVEKGYGNLNVWDVESICIFNKDVIVPVEENAFDKERIPRHEEPNEYDYDDTIKQKKRLQMSSDYSKYGNENIRGDMSTLFNGKHPGILAQGHGNNKDTKLARRFNGMIKSGI